jgi:hypothetical protein
MELLVLQSFYYKAYDRICSVDPRVLVVMSDSWRAGALDGFGCAPPNPKVYLKCVSFHKGRVAPLRA